MEWSAFFCADEPPSNHHHHHHSEQVTRNPMATDDVVDEHDLEVPPPQLSNQKPILVYNASHDALGLWPDGDESSVLPESCHEEMEYRRLIQRAQAIALNARAAQGMQTTTVRQVIAQHLEAAEQGYFDLDFALQSLHRYDGTNWKFEPGDLVEYQGRDLLWHLGLVSKSTGDETVDDETKSDCTKDAAVCSIISPAGVRHGFGSSDKGDYIPAPRPSNIAVRAWFGPTPFRWQQMALLEAEDAMVLRKSSPNDIQAMDWYTWAETRWDAWLAEPENAAFKSFHDDPRLVSAGARAALREVVLEPFQLITRIANEWNIETSLLSPYLYMAILGRGLAICAVVCCLQVSAVWIVANYDRDNEHRRHWAAKPGVFPCAAPGRDRGNALARYMILLMTIYYMLKVVPDQLARVMSVMGTAGHTSTARLTALRHSISVCDRDDLRMKLGLRLHSIMNTSFDCVLFALNLHLLYTTRSPLEILLNSLAIDIIRSFDESVCSSAWWDPEGRYIKAGAVEMVFRSFLDIRAIARRRHLVVPQGGTEAHARRRSKNRPSHGCRRGIPMRQRGVRSSYARALFGSADAKSASPDSELVRLHLEKDLDYFYGDDLHDKGRRAKTRCADAVFFYGINSAILGRYKRIALTRWRVFHRWDEWRDETLDFDRSRHLISLHTHLDTVRLVYAAVPGFPVVSRRLPAKDRYRWSLFFHHNPGLANLASTASGHQLYSACAHVNPHTGRPLVPDPARRFVNIVDSLLDLVSTWVVLIFPFLVALSVVYFPVCY